MINLILSIVAGALVTVLLHAIFGFGWIACVLPGSLVMVAVYLLLARRIATQVQAIAEQAQVVLQGIRSEKERGAALDKAITIFQSALRLANWQFFIGSEIRANVGMLQYMKGDYAAAKPHLAGAISRNWMAKSYLGCIHYMGKEPEPMKSAFEDAVTGGGKKEPLAWAAYCWCLENTKQHDAAVAVASRAVAENPSDEKLKKLQNQLQNGKRLKMDPFTPNWWQFGLEQPATAMPQVRFQRYRRR